jgi:hypothetical protein
VVVAGGACVAPTFVRMVVGGTGAVLADALGVVDALAALDASRFSAGAALDDALLVLVVVAAAAAPGGDAAEEGTAVVP